jgi:Xaa-Pro aminopeptidase
MREIEVAGLARQTGLPLGCHPMLSSGPRAAFGLESPSDKVIERGEPFTMAYSLWGALTARAGWLIADASELPTQIVDYLERLAIPYFACAAEWYETIGIGVTGGEIDALVRKHIGDPFFGLGLNPGHLIHLDEWMNTPIYPGSQERLQSGQALQCDIIPATGSPYFTSNIEDGIALLDEPGRAEFAERHPEAWQRVEARRAFMAEALGIRLKPEVLPFSNLQGYLSPFILAPRRVLARA